MNTVSQTRQLQQKAIPQPNMVTKQNNHTNGVDDRLHNKLIGKHSIQSAHQELEIPDNSLRGTAKGILLPNVSQGNKATAVVIAHSFPF